MSHKEMVFKITKCIFPKKEEKPITMTASPELSTSLSKQTLIILTVKV